MVVIHRKITETLRKLFFWGGTLGQLVKFLPSMNILPRILFPISHNPGIAKTIENPTLGDIFKDDQNFILAYTVRLRLVLST